MLFTGLQGYSRVAAKDDSPRRKPWEKERQNGKPRRGVRSHRTLLRPYGAEYLAVAVPGLANIMHEPAPEGRKTIAHGASRGEMKCENKSPVGAKELPESQVRLWRGLIAFAHNVLAPGAIICRPYGAHDTYSPGNVR